MAKNIRKILLMEMILRIKIILVFLYHHGKIHCYARL